MYVVFVFCSIMAPLVSIEIPSTYFILRTRSILIALGWQKYEQNPQPSHNSCVIKGRPSELPIALHKANSKHRSH